MLQSTSLLTIHSPGSYVPISVGQMRNRWFPAGTARYVVGDDLKAVKTGKIQVERDPEFSRKEYHAGIQAKENAALKAVREKAKEEAKRARNTATAAAKAAARDQLNVCPH
jgi:hypothetical protein